MLQKVHKALTGFFPRQIASLLLVMLEMTNLANVKCNERRLSSDNTAEFCHLPETCHLSFASACSEYKVKGQALVLQVPAGQRFCRLFTTSTISKSIAGSQPCRTSKSSLQNGPGACSACLQPVALLMLCSSNFHASPATLAVIS